MPRILRVFSLSVAFYLAGFLVIAVGTKTLATFGPDGLVSPFLAVGLALLVVVAPFVAGSLVPGAPRRAFPTCPHCGATLAGSKPVIDPSMLW